MRFSSPLFVFSDVDSGYLVALYSVRYRKDLPQIAAWVHPLF
jgi:hypothetical protein